MTAEFVSAAQLQRIREALSEAIETDTTNVNSPLFKLLATSDRVQVAKLMTLHRFQQGQIIFREGDPGDAMYIIRSGRIAVIKGDLNQPTVLATRSVGEIIGEMALLENKPRSATLVALEDASLFRIRQADFQQFMSTNVSLGMSILSALSHRLRLSDEARRISVTTERRLHQRVTELQTEKARLLELQQLRQETNDLIIHDLRNPLGLIAGAVNLLELSLPEEVLRNNLELLELINSNVDRLKRLVDSLLDVARMENGEVPIIPVEISPFDLIQDTLRLTRPLLKDTGIHLEAAVGTDLPPIKADEEKLGRVLANLLDNAIKYTPPGGTITVEAGVVEHDIQFAVSNTGPVIPEADRQRIFDRFTRVAGNQPKTRGFGLGLAFCRLAVEAHGGRIWVEPLPGDTGNRFVFTLPLPVELNKLFSPAEKAH